MLYEVITEKVFPMLKSVDLSEEIVLSDSIRFEFFYASRITSYNVCYTKLLRKAIRLWIDAYNAPYVLTKPLHHTQRVLQQNEDGSIIINLFLIENYELERVLLGFGDGVEVLKPERLRKIIHQKLESALKRYENENQ